MKPFSELNLGFSDAENYRRRENRELLNKIFLRNQQLDKLCDPGISFLIGEKGTGKTAYSVFLSNNEYLNTQAVVKYIRETEYTKFISLKQEKHLNLSDYTSIWKVIILLLMSQQISEREGGIEFFKRFTKLKSVQEAIDEYYARAFSPEIIQALQFVQESKIAAELLSKYAKASGEEKESLTFSENRFQTNLFYIQRKFELALSQVKLSKSHILFIDGIDIRPSSIPYLEYLDCVKGLANAVWELNNDVFPTIRDSKGRLRVVLLVRPDIFQTLGLQNQNTKIRDNSVFLDWRTEYINHRNSDLFKAIEHLLTFQQDQSIPEGTAWEQYFNWNAPNVYQNIPVKTSFIAFLRASYYRPRDIVTYLMILKNISKEKQCNTQIISLEDFENANCRRQYSDYLLGEVKDHLSFYYGSDDYEIFLKFFEFLNGKADFHYSEYLAKYEKLIDYINSSKIPTPQFMSSANGFLQFLYDLNIISYVEYPVEDKPYIRWCFRERSYANISPKVKEGLTYRIFGGLYKSLNVGQEFRK